LFYGAGFKLTLLLTLTVSLLFLATGLASAATYYIAPAGSDSNDGSSSSSPWATFAHAMSVLQPGDTLYLMDGTYNVIDNSGALPSIIYFTQGGTSGNPITIQALNKWNAILDGGGTGTILPSTGDVSGTNCVWFNSNVSNVVIKNLQIQNCAEGLSWNNSNSNITVFGNKIHDCTQGIGWGTSCNNAIIDSNIIYNFGNSSLPFYGIYGRGNNGTIQNNLIYNSLGGWNIQLGVEPPDTLSGTWNIVNNTLLNTSGEYGIVLYGGASGISNLNVFNNIGSGPVNSLLQLYNVSTALPSGWNIRYNLMDGTNSALQIDYQNTIYSYSGSQVANNLGNTPAGFVSASTNNYALAAGSAAIGTGTPMYMSGYDIAGTPRSVPDIGAYDASATTDPVITATAGTGGRISPAGTVSVNQGASQSFTITPNTGYSVAGVTVDGNSVGAVPTYTFSNVTTNHTISAAFAAVTSTTSTNPTFAVNSGGGQYTSQSGVAYEADTNYSGGTAASTTGSISGTTDPILYQSERYGNFSYNIPLANGNYIVTLKFAETYWNSTGQRVFNVSMQGTQVISNLDIYALVGKNAAYDVTIPVTVTGGTLNINFISVVDYAKVSAILITPAQYTITASAGSGGSISPSGSIVLNQSASQSYSITPDTGYTIAHVTVDGTSVGAVASYTFSNVTANHSITATFASNASITRIKRGQGKN
jgi:hypothetical protein